MESYVVFVLSALRHHHGVRGGLQTASALWNYMLYLYCPRYVIITGCGGACRQRARDGGEAASGLAGLREDPQEGPGPNRWEGQHQLPLRPQLHPARCLLCPVVTPLFTVGLGNIGLGINDAPDTAIMVLSDNVRADHHSRRYLPCSIEPLSLEAVFALQH